MLIFCLEYGFTPVPVTSDTAIPVRVVVRNPETWRNN